MQTVGLDACQCCRHPPHLFAAVDQQSQEITRLSLCKLAGQIQPITFPLHCNDPGVNGPFGTAAVEKRVNNDARTGETPAPK